MGIKIGGDSLHTLLFTNEYSLWELKINPIKTGHLVVARIKYLGTFITQDGNSEKGRTE